MKLSLSRFALAVALALPVAGAGVMVATPAMAAPAGPDLSKPFLAVGVPFQTALEKVKKAPSPEGIADLRAQYEKVLAAATKPDDKFTAGNWGIQLGSLAKDDALQGKGIQLMVDSGKTPPELLPKLHFALAQMALQAKDNAGARKNLDASIAAGNKEAEPHVWLAEINFEEKQSKAGFDELNKAIDIAGTAAPENWYRRGLGFAYEARDYAQAVNFSTKLVKAYPVTKSWSAAIAVLRDLGQLPSQDTIDLMRLMARTNSWAEERDYGEFVQAADARRNPGEVKAVIEAGVAAGKLDASKTFYAEALKTANGRIGPDKASLPGFEKDARAANATVATVSGAGDALLSYGEAAKASELYKIALGKPGVDKPVVLTRLGIAQVDSGDYAGAQATFAQVQGPRKPMADLWSLYAAQKAAGK